MTSDAAPMYTEEQLRLSPHKLKEIPVEAQTEALCLAAVETLGAALLYVANQTPTICQAAIEQDSTAIQFMKRQEPEMCLLAVGADGNNLQFVDKPTPEICLAAVQQYWAALRFVSAPMQTPEVCQLAVDLSPFALDFVAHQTPKLCFSAVQRNGCALSKVRQPTHEICLQAIRNNADALLYVPTHSVELCQEAVRKDGNALVLVKLPRDDMLNPASGQLEDWLTVFRACTKTNVKNRIHLLLARIPLGKQYCEEWCQITPSGVPLMDVGSALASEVARLAPHDHVVTDFVHRVHQQQEWILRRQLAGSHARDPVDTPDVEQEYSL